MEKPIPGTVPEMKMIRRVRQLSYATPDVVVSISEAVKTCLRKLEIKSGARKIIGKCQGGFAGLATTGRHVVGWLVLYNNWYH